MNNEVVNEIKISAMSVVAAVFMAAILGAAAWTARGAEVSHPWHKEKTYINDGAKVVETDWKYVAKGWRPRMRPGHEPEGRFESYSDYLDKWIIVHTNDVIKIDSKPSRSKFKDKIDEMEPGYKKQKAIEKASVKFGKNVEKVRKDFAKYRDKSATQEEMDFWQSLLDSIPVPNKD